MTNNINNKRERDVKNITITLGKTHDGYYYFGDSLAETRKIKIPLGEINGKDDKIFGHVELQETKKHEYKLVRNSNHLDEENRHDIIINGNFSSLGQQNNNVIQMAPQIPEEAPLLAKLIEKTNKQPIIIPGCAQWFKFDEIHEIEMKALPEFFCGKFPSKTPEIYKEYRNYIINLYRENTNFYLSSTSKNLYFYF